VQQGQQTKTSCYLLEQDFTFEFEPVVAKKWALRKKYKAKSTFTTLGAYPDMSRKQARMLAAETAQQAGLLSRMFLFDLTQGLCYIQA
jgi:hypothetical protein